jgi:hypothetical protein
MPSWSEFSVFPGSRLGHLSPSSAPCVHAPGAFALVLPVGLSVSVPWFFNPHVLSRRFPCSPVPNANPHDWNPATSVAIPVVPSVLSQALPVVQPVRCAVPDWALLSAHSPVLQGQSLAVSPVPPSVAWWAAPSVAKSAARSVKPSIRTASPTTAAWNAATPLALHASEVFRRSSSC